MPLEEKFVLVEFVLNPGKLEKQYFLRRESRNFVMISMTQQVCYQDQD